MKKTIIFTLSAIFLAIIHIACENQKTMQEYLREEKKAIERYISKQGITVLNEYPKDSIFQDEKDYFKTNEGLYMHVVDRGNTERRAVPMKDEIQVRFKYMYYVKTYIAGTTDSIVPPSAGFFPLEFIYGQSGSYQQLACDGWAIPLAYVGEGAIVDLIIPSSLGSSTDSDGFNAVFYKNLTYTHFY
jgi:hypothetical protein